jgi:phage gpG-like protein
MEGKLTIGGEVRGVTVKYARIHEFGGTITPKKAQYLAIPMAAAKTGTGVSRYESPRQVPGLFVFKSKAGNLLLARREGKKGKLKLFFVLKKSVKIPARPYLGPAVNAIKPTVKDRLMAAVLKAVAGTA